MGRDIVAAAKEFEDHAQKGNIPESLARELHTMSDADRLAVAKQVDWDMKHSSNPSLPKVEFYDSGDLKSIERTSNSANSIVTEQRVLDKTTGKTVAEINKTDTTLSYEHSTNVEIKERDAAGHLTHHYDATTTVSGFNVKLEINDERRSYDASTGKLKSGDETNNNSKTHRTYDSATENLRQEDISNADKTHETIKYNSNGDKLSREKQYGNNGDEGTREWIYSPRTGKPVYSEFRAPDGTVKNKNNIDENGKWTSIEE